MSLGRQFRPSLISGSLSFSNYTALTYVFTLPLTLCTITQIFFVSTDQYYRTTTPGTGRVRVCLLL
jgi:hypothetical protein